MDVDVRTSARINELQEVGLIHTYTEKANEKTNRKGTAG